MTNKKTIKFVDQGGYGCVFRPEIVCGTNKLGNMKFISKIYRSSHNVDSDIKKEEYISKLIRKIPNYMSFFVPLMKTCEVNLQNYKRDPESNKELDKCDIFFEEPYSKEKQTTKTDKNEYVSAKMRFISSTLEKQLNFLVNNMLEKDFVKKFGQTFQHLSNALKLCIQAGFIHYDIKQDNILYDEYTHSPVIIDYGISVILSNLKMAITNVEIPILQEIFYTKRFYLYWCIDIYLISQFLHHDYENKQVTVRNEFLLDKNTIFTQLYLDKVVDDYLSQFSQKMGLNKDDELLKEMRESYIKFYTQFVGKPWFDILNTCLAEKWYVSWDYYSLCLTYLDIYNRLIEYRTYLGKNSKMQGMVVKWKNVIKSDPLNRMK